MRFAIVNSKIAIASLQQYLLGYKWSAKNYIFVGKIFKTTHFFTKEL
jgi:hypothetical protein